MTTQTPNSTKTTISARAIALRAGTLVVGLVVALATACSDSEDGLAPLVPRPVGATSADGGPAATIRDAAIGEASHEENVALAEKLFRAIPDFTTGCGGPSGSCHITGTGDDKPPTWLAPPDMYKSIKDFDSKQTGPLKFIVPDPTQSRLFTKGQHLGQALDEKSSLGLGVKKWLDAEAAALQSARLPETVPVAITTGTNVAIDISSAGMGIAGAKITFDATITGTTLSMSNMKLVAPATTGVHVLHPIFVRVPVMGAQVEDPADNFSNLDQTVGAGGTVQLGVGTVILTGLPFSATDKLAIEFTKIEPGTVVDSGTLATGCKNVAGFQAIAGVFKGMNINPNCTAACHKSGGNGSGALDLDGIAGANTDYKAACNQALLRVNLTNKAQSDILLHPSGGAGNHQGGSVNDVAGYRAMVTMWMNGE